ARRRAFEVNAFTVVTTTVARAFEFVFTGLPVGRATEVCAARVDDEEPIGRSRHPDAVLLLPFGIDTQRVVAWSADAKDAGRFENRARQEEPHEHQEERRQRSRDGKPHDATAHFIYGRIRGGLHDRGPCGWRRGLCRCRTCWRSSYTRGGQLIGLTIQVQTSVESIPNCQVLRTYRGYTSTLLTEG